jgi:hypothetical protein
LFLIQTFQVCFLKSSLHLSIMCCRQWFYWLTTISIVNKSCLRERTLFSISYLLLIFRFVFTFLSSKTKLFQLKIPFLFYRLIIYTCRCYLSWRERNILNWILGLRQTTFVALFYHQVYEISPAINIEN